MSDLFDVPASLSPRLEWMALAKQWGIYTREATEPADAEKPCWIAESDQSLNEKWMYPRSEGATEFEAMNNLASRHDIQLPTFEEWKMAKLKGGNE